ncbi:hypothetical protein RA279_28735, partial [Pseudomonas syringae pv. tagetis]
MRYLKCIIGLLGAHRFYNGNPVTATISNYTLGHFG